MAARAELGMRAIEREAVALELPDRQVLRETYGRLHEVYADAYGWKPPEQEIPAFAEKSMRVHVRRWINEWDIQRIYQAVPETETETLATDYTEERELEKERDETVPETSS
jgi:hypothetical protein